MLPFDYAIPVLIAALLGGVVGFERALRGVSVGLRTHMIIAVSTCLFTLLAEIMFRRHGGDPTMLAHIISGVGFIGAGAVIHHHERTLGLTSAATIWLVAGIGMAVGLGEVFMATFVTLIALFTLHILEPLSDWLTKNGSLARPKRALAQELRQKSRAQRKR